MDMPMREKDQFILISNSTKLNLNMANLKELRVLRLKKHRSTKSVKRTRMISHYGKQQNQENHFGIRPGETGDQVGTSSARLWQ